MATVKASDLRGWAATWLAGTTGYAFRESPRLLGVDGEAASVAHQSFSVLLDAEEDTGLSRQKSGDIVHVAQKMRVRFAWRVRPGADQLGDYDDALDAAGMVVRRFMQIPTTGLTDIKVRYDGIPSRLVLEGGKWVLTDVEFTVYHTITLAAPA
jgi:hypothetical protein